MNLLESFALLLELLLVLAKIGLDADGTSLIGFVSFTVARRHDREIGDRAIDRCRARDRAVWAQGR